MSYSLLLGDCLDIMKDIPTGTVDFVLADLPYGTTQNKWDTLINLNLLWKEYDRVCKRNACIALFCIEPFSALLGASNIKNLKYSWVWVKENATGHLNAKIIPLKNHEYIYIFYKQQPTYSPQNLLSYGKITKRGGNGSNYGRSGTSNLQEFTNYPRTVLYFDRDREKLHPTQKPVKLLEYLVKTYTYEGEIVLDNVMGSGSTGIACIDTNRNFIGIEKDEKYFSIAKKRIEEYKNI